jgi:hypothetical protein
MPVMYKSIVTALAILGCLMGEESLITQPVFSDSTRLQAKIGSRDANNDLVNSQYQLYVPLGNRMKELNMNKYRLAAFIFVGANHLK